MRGCRHRWQDHVPYRRRRDTRTDGANPRHAAAGRYPHPCSGAPNLGGAFTNIVQEGRLLPAALAAKHRGVIFDVGHGGGSFDFTVAEPAIAQGCLPDTISSDVHAVSGHTPGTPPPLLG